MQSTLKLRLPGGSLSPVEVSPTMLVKDLLQIAAESAHCKNGVYLLSGFPPRKICFSGGPHSDQTLVNDLFKSGEIVTVQPLLESTPSLLSSIPSASHSSPITSPTITTTSTSPGDTRERHDRSSKARASELITAEIIAIKESEKNKEAAERKRKLAAKTTDAVNSASSSNKKRAKLDFGPGEGHRLGSETSSVPQDLQSPEQIVRESLPTPQSANLKSSDQKASPPKRQHIKLSSSEQGIAEKLVSAMGASGGAKDGASEYLQKVAQSALDQQYDIANAGERVTAAMAGLYSFEPLSSGGRSLASGDCSQLRVRYKSTPKKKFSEEVVDNLPLTALAPLFEFLVKGEGSSDATRASLRPHEMARLSIRTFWAVIRYGGPLFRNEAPPGMNDSTLEGVPSMPGQCLKAICPSIDWSFLEERSKRLSEKAIANAAQVTSKTTKRAIETTITDASVKSLISVVPSPSPYHPPPPLPPSPSLPTHLVVDDDGEIHYSEPAHATLESLVLSSMVIKDCSLDSNPTDLQLPTAVLETLSRLKLFFTSSITFSSPSKTLPSGQIFNIDSLLNHHVKSPEISLVSKHIPYNGHRMINGMRTSHSTDTETFICDLCSKSRIICSEEEDLNKIRAAESWTCKESTINGRLYKRGGCAAPDDDLCEILGSEDAAVCCDALKLSSVTEVASALMVPLDELLFSGHVGPLTLSFLKTRCTYLQVDSSSSSSSSSSTLPQPLPSTLVDEFVEAASKLGLLANETATKDEDSFVEPSISVLQWRRILDQRIPRYRLLLSYMKLDPSSRQSRVNLMRGLHLGKYGIKLSLQEFHARGHLLLLAAAQYLISHDSSRSSFDNAASLLLNPIGLVAAYSVAQSWQAFARGDVMAELLASIVGTSEDDIDNVDADTVLESLTELHIQTPADLAMIDAGVLLSALRSRGEAFESLQLSTVEKWKKSVKTLIGKQPWLTDIITEA
jgi:hypothetical protein